MTRMLTPHHGTTLCPKTHRPSGLQTRTGLSLVEVLMGMAIAAMIFTSLAFAIHAGIRSEAINRDYARNIQTARGTLSSLTSAIRNAQDVDLEDAVAHGNNGKSAKNLLIQGPPKHGVLPPAAAFRWDGAHGQLVKYQNANDDHGNPQHGKAKAAGNLKNVDFNVRFLTDAQGTLVKDPQGNAQVEKVTISLVVGTDEKTQVTLSASAAPRRVAPVY